MNKKKKERRRKGVVERGVIHYIRREHSIAKDERSLSLEVFSTSRYHHHSHNELPN
jgi:hypothetical protein